MAFLPPGRTQGPMFVLLSQPCSALASFPEMFHTLVESGPQATLHSPLLAASSRFFTKSLAKVPDIFSSWPGWENPDVFTEQEKQTLGRWKRFSKLPFASLPGSPG